MTFEQTLEEIRLRRWENIKNEWLNYTPQISRVGSHPPNIIEDLPEFHIVASDIIANGNAPQKSDISSIRITLLWEAIYMLHKARHVLSATEMHATTGIRSWSLSSAYQSSIFAAKSIIHFLGVSFPIYDSRPFLVDIWPISSDNYDKRTKKRVPVFNEINFFYLGFNGEIQHRHLWNIFLRILRVSQIDIISKDLIQAIRNIDIKDFAKQRNYIHYQNREWLYNDLYNYVFDENFGVRKNNFSIELSYQELKSDYTFILAQVLIKVAFELLNSLAQSSKVLSDERDLLLNSITNPSFHPIYIRNHGVII